MFKNIRDMAIGKQLLISLIFITLMFTVFSMNAETIYASDLNESVDELGVELDIEDKLENSQENEILQATKSLNGGTYNDIQKAINSASDGDKIQLSGTFTAKSADDLITVNKKLTITSTSQATLNGKNLCNAFYLTSKSAGTVISNLKFINGYSPNEGGAIRVFAKSITIDNCEFEKNNAAWASGAIHTSYTPSVAENIVIKNCRFKGNTAGTAGGAAGVFGYNFKITNCDFDSNSVKKDANCFGGAIQVGMDTAESKGLVSYCNFTNNKATSTNGTSHGGAGCFRNGTSYENCIFRGNVADHGGAITFHATGSLKNCQFYDNVANQYGGALSISLEHNTMSLTLDNCIFEGNRAPLGGAAKLDGMNIVIRNSEFTNNTATQYGGAVNIEAENVTILSSDFNDNVANIDGGALFITGNHTVINRSSFIGNDALPDVKKLDDGLGGAVYVNSTQAFIENNVFRYNTARNGSAVYYDKFGDELKLVNNVMDENQAWVYLLPIFARDIYYGEVEEINSIIHGGNNIAKYNDLDVSNAVYNAAKSENIIIDGETPVLGATMSGQLYQDDREYNMDVLLTVTHEDGEVVYNNTLKSTYLGEVAATLSNLRPGLYEVRSTHFEDTYYKGITNTTSFRVIPKIDNKILKATPKSDEINYDDMVLWTLIITNNGPNDATEVVVRDILPEGVEYVNDTSGGKYDESTGILTIGNLAVGQTISVDILTIVKKTGEITNDANVTAKEYDIDLTNNEDNATILVNPACDLQVIKMVNNSNPNYNDLVDWTITVRNNGPDTAHDVVVKDSLPKALIYISSTGNYDAAGNVWKIGTLDVNEERSIHIITRVNATGVTRNVVSVSGKEHDIDESNNEDDEIITVNACADLGIVKSVNVSEANFGDLVKWTLVITNNGPDGATGVYIMDFLPEGFEYVSSVLSKGSYSNGRINVGNMNVGETLSFDIICRVGTTGSFVNVAAVSGNEYDYDLTNNEDNESVSINPAADLEVVKSVNNSNPNYDDLVDWTVTVRNNGPDTAHDVVVSDILPDSVKFISSSGNYDANAGKWNVGTLDVGKSVILHIITQVKTTGTIDNIVTVSGKEFDYNMSNNVDDERIRVNASTDLAIVKSVNVSAANFADLVKWTLVITNNGPNNATGVYVTDILPQGFEYVSSVLSRGSYSNGKITVGNLAVGEVLSFDIICRVGATGSFVNVAVVGGNEYDYDLTNNEDNESILINPAADLQVIKTVDDSNPKFGQMITWTVTVKNNGPDDAHEVIIRDVLPDSVIWIEDDSKEYYDHLQGIWSFGGLPAGASKTMHILCRVNATGMTTNEVTVTGREYDYNQTNNYDNSTINVEPAADLIIQKQVNDTNPDYNSLVKWTVTIKNNGPDDAHGVYVDEIIPEGLIFIDYTATKGFYDNGMWAMCCLNNSETQTLEIICKVNKTGKTTNIVVVHADEYDPDPSNNGDNESIDVAPAVDLELIKDVNNYNPNYGEEIVWTIVIRNNGPDNATGVVVDDVLSSKLEFVSYKSSRGEFSANRWNVGTLNVGGVEYLNIACIVKDIGEISNYAEVSSNEFDWNESNNYDVATIEGDPLADLAVEKIVNNSKPNYGDLVKWTVVVTNNGPNEATGVKVIDVLPEGVVLVKSSSNSYVDGIWHVGYMNVGDTRQLEIICKVTSTGDITNFASVYGDQLDPDLSNNDADSTINVPPASDLSITKIASKYYYTVGDVIRYAIEIVNNGPDRAENIVVEDIMDASLKLKSFRASAGDFDKLTKTWEIDALEYGESATLDIDAVALASGVSNNIVKASSDTYDPDLSNNEDNALVNVGEKQQKDIEIPQHQNKLVENKVPKQIAAKILEKNVSGNSFFVLLISLIFSMIFVGDGISKRK